jgi:signal transduction histidine kinase
MIQFGRYTALPTPRPGRPRAAPWLERSTGGRYGVAVASTAIALLCALAIELPLHIDTNLLLVAAVAVSAWYGGRGPGLLAGVLSALAIAALFLPQHPLLAAPALARIAYLGAFLVVALIVSTTTEALHQARAQAEAHAEELEELTVELEQQMEEVQTLSENVQESNDALSEALAAAERTASRATRLQEVTAALSEARTVGDVADVLLGKGLGVVEASCGVLARMDGTRFEVIAARGYASDVETRLLALSLEDAAPLTHAVRTGEPAWLHSAEEYRERYPGALEDCGAAGSARAHVAVPLRQGEEIVGGVEMSFAESTALGVADRAFTLLLAQAAADALVRARSYDAERDARRDAELLARARSDVLAIVAHDLRNPLNLIGSSSQLLSELDMAPDQRRRMHEVTQRAVRQMNRLIGDLLDATRLQAGRMSLDLSDVDVSEIVREAEELFLHTAADRRIHMHAVAPDHRCVVRADSGRVLQALANLVGNALKFTGAGGSVTFSADCTDNGVVFRVADSGPGIAEDQQARLFEGFWQAREGDRRGVGLGLAITKGIVDAHGGRVWVDSAPGEGSTFCFALPARRAAPALIAAG